MSILLTTLRYSNMIYKRERDLYKLPTTKITARLVSACKV